MNDVEPNKDDFDELFLLRDKEFRKYIKVAKDAYLKNISIENLNNAVEILHQSQG